MTTKGPTTSCPDRLQSSGAASSGAFPYRSLCPGLLGDHCSTKKRRQGCRMKGEPLTPEALTVLVYQSLGGMTMRRNSRAFELMESLLLNYSKLHWRYFNGYIRPDEDPLVREVKRLLGKTEFELTRDGWTQRPEQKQIGNPAFMQQRIGPNAVLVAK